jgi:hypothetical protein
MNENTVPPTGGRMHKQSFNASMVPPTATLQRSTFQTSWKKSWPWLIPYLTITFLSPVLGLFLRGWLGFGVGEGLAIVNLVIGFYAVTRMIKETRH